MCNLVNLEEYLCITDIIEKDCDYFLSLSNVNGIGLGYKYTNGVQTNQLALQVFVLKKISENCLCQCNIIPPIYKGIQTDVIEIGEIRASALGTKYRPMSQGYSIGTMLRNTGTAGAVVVSGDGLNMKYYILSNAHIFCRNNTYPIGGAIVSPGYDDNKDMDNNKVATLAKFIPIKYNSSDYNYYDCAIGEITDLNLVSNYIYMIGNINGTVPPTLNQKVQKTGRTSGYTRGTVMSLSACIRVNWDFGGYSLFAKQVLTTKISEGGDSGSLVLDMNNNAVGLIFSSTETISVFTPIDPVLSALKVQLV